jgi:hypothetical protein
VLGSGRGEHPAFYEKPLCSVRGYHAKAHKYPSTEAVEDELLIYFRLVKAGYAPTVREAAQMTAREVLQALHYEKFISDYEAAFVEINRE